MPWHIHGSNYHQNLIIHSVRSTNWQHPVFCHRNVKSTRYKGGLKLCTVLRHRTEGLLLSRTHWKNLCDFLPDKHVIIIWLVFFFLSLLNSLRSVSFTNFVKVCNLYEFVIFVILWLVILWFLLVSDFCQFMAFVILWLLSVYDFSVHDCCWIWTSMVCAFCPDICIYSGTWPSDHLTTWLRDQV